MRMRLSDREGLGQWLRRRLLHSHSAPLGSRKGNVETSRLIALAHVVVALILRFLELASAEDSSGLLAWPLLTSSSTLPA
jgi:hypothetical protein